MVLREAGLCVVAEELAEELVEVAEVPQEVELALAIAVDEEVAGVEGVEPALAVPEEVGGELGPTLVFLEEEVDLGERANKRPLESMELVPMICDVDMGVIHKLWKTRRPLLSNNLILCCGSVF